MCGINGFTGSTHESIVKMNKAISHRGPDGVGFFSDQNVSLGHVRLAVVDLSQAGHQPMGYGKQTGASSEHHKTEQFSRARYVMTYNGEIYNYLEVRVELEELGFVFSTQTDSEVILAAYQQWGPDALHKFNGMWAFCIYDTQEQTLFLSRDRFGQKPLYYTEDSGQFIFSSEMKGILAHEPIKAPSLGLIDKESVQLYFSLGFIPAPKTIFSNISKLEAGHYAVYDLKTKKVTKTQYYDLPAYDPLYDKQALLHEGTDLLQSATALRMRSDVPVGSFLSGGLDSSGVTQEVVASHKPEVFHTFSVGFEGVYDETKYINEVSKSVGTTHHHTYFSETDFEDMIEQHALVYDEPYGSPSGFPTRVVSQLAREHVTVALSGDGGDEVFGGYSSHIIGRQLELLNRLPKSLVSFAAKHAPLYKIRTACRIVLGDHAHMRVISQNRQGYAPLVFKLWSEEKMKYALDKAQGNLSEAARIYDVLFFTLPDDFLVKVDKASMAHALEVRSPFMDYRMMEFAQKIPTRYKVSLRGSGKLLLKQILSKRLPYNIVYRKKQGFTPPIEQWITRDSYQTELADFVEKITLWDTELYDLYKSRYLGHDDKIARIFQIRLYMFKNWFDRWII